jgi:hypothetical protein
MPRSLGLDFKFSLEVRLILESFKEERTEIYEDYQEDPYNQGE